MQRIIWLGLLLLALATGRDACGSAGAAETDGPAIQADKLRCEYLVNPLGIDATSPRLSWIVRSSRRGARQTAYQIIAVGSAEELAKNAATLWDSGQVPSSATAQIVYGGPALKSRQACWWKVRVWDEAGHASAWSTPAHWEMGLLARSDWQAQWIDAPPTKPLGPIEITQAHYQSSDGKSVKDVTTILQSLVRNGALNIIADNATLGGDPAPKKNKRLLVNYNCAGQSYEEMIKSGSRLQLPRGPLPYLRRSFELGREVRQARLYVTALGLYEMRLNGTHVGDHVLAPEWTDYNKRIQYQTYDVTKQVKRGANALAAQVANGWYAGHIGNGGYQQWGKVPALLAQLEVTYADGATERIVTDNAWKSHAGPILAADFMFGEKLDARLKMDGWDQPQLDQTSWETVTAHALTTETLEAQNMEPVRVLAELKPKKVTEPAPGHWVFDLGQNMVGVVHLKLYAPAGTSITLRHAEMLDPDGTLYTTNLRSASSVDTYVCRGTKHANVPEFWQPKFTFHGFRYVELTGLKAKPDLETVTGMVLGSDTPLVGEFECSDPRINQLQSNIVWGQRGNFLSVPTDCPQRDERLGWMGDAQVFIRTATCNADVAAFFTKWLLDVRDAQLPDGRFTVVSPKTSGGSAVPGWADAGVICPWTIYEAYGDKRVLEQAWPGMVAWVEWCRAHSRDLIFGKPTDFGDWLAIGSSTSKDLIGTAYFAHSTDLLAQTAEVLGKKIEAEHFRQLFAEIKRAFNQKYVQADGRITSGTQTAYALALKFDLLPDALRPAAARYLEEDIAAKQEHLSTGFLGVGYLLPALTQAGKSDTAYRLLMQDTFPSWLFSVKNGATTIWERWDGWTPENGFQTPSMNSFNHYSLGSCGEWFYTTVAGIEPLAPGFAACSIHPRIGGGLTFAKARYDSIRGPIVSEWRRTGDKLALHVEIPANMNAMIHVPATAANQVQEQGRPAAQTATGAITYQAGAAVVPVGSGVYDFASTLRP